MFTCSSCDALQCFNFSSVNCSCVQCFDVSFVQVIGCYNLIFPNFIWHSGICADMNMKSQMVSIVNMDFNLLVMCYCWDSEFLGFACFCVCRLGACVCVCVCLCLCHMVRILAP